MLRLHSFMLFRSKGYVHRDIKPENVLLTADGHCKMVR
jgi:serine/threonine protein kinase